MPRESVGRRFSGVKRRRDLGVVVVRAEIYRHTHAGDAAMRREEKNVSEMFGCWLWMT
jgi:hypothetical protein